MTRVSRRGRIVDLTGLLLFLTGFGLCLRAWVGFRSIPDHQRSAGGELWETVRLADGYWRLQKIGAGLMIAAVLVFVAAWWFAGRRGRAGSSGVSDDRQGRG